MNILIICLGVMYGVAGANTALRAIAKGLANGISKKNNEYSTYKRYNFYNI